MRGVWHLLRFERRHEPVASTRRFVGRVLLVWGVIVGASGMALGLGVAGYHYLGGLSWIDALLEAALLLGGMGPLHPVEGVAAKLFAAFYALFSGLFFIAAVGVMLSPIVHRIVHRLHVEVPEMKRS